MATIRRSLNTTLSAQPLPQKPGDALYDRLITRNRYYHTSDSQTRSLNMDYSWEHFFGKKGSFTLQGYTKISGSDEDTHNNRSLEYLRDNRSETLWQYYERNNHGLSTQLGAELEYWLSSKVYLDLSDNVTYSRTRAIRDIYTDHSEENVVGGMPTTPDLANTMGNLMHQWTNSFSLKSTITPVKSLMIMPKFNWNVYREKADYHYGQLDTTAVRTSYGYEPSLFLKWKMSRVRNMDFSFFLSYYGARPGEHARLSQHHQSAVYFCGQSLPWQITQSYDQI